MTTETVLISLLVALFLVGCTLAMIAIVMAFRWLMTLKKSIDNLAEETRCMQMSLADFRQELPGVSDDLQSFSDQLQTMRESMDKEAWPELRRVVGHLETVPRLLEAVGKIGRAQLAILEKQGIEQQKANPFGRNTAPAPPKDYVGANMEDEIHELMRTNGWSREVAMLQLNSANNASPWGDGLMDNWRNG